MLITSVDTSIKLTREPESCYLLAPSHDNKVRVKISDATLSITEVELKPPLLLADANVVHMKRKAHYPVIYIQVKTLQRVLRPSRSLSIMHSLNKLPKGFSLLSLKTTHSLVLPVRIHSTFIIMI